MKQYLVTQTYWDNDAEEEEYYYNEVEVEANSPDEAIQKACLDGLFDENGYEVEDYTISDIYDVEELL